MKGNILTEIFYKFKPTLVLDAWSVNAESFFRRKLVIIRLPFAFLIPEMTTPINVHNGICVGLQR